MSKRECGCVYADAHNTPSVKSGYEMGGYLKQACPVHAPKPPAPPGVQGTFNDQQEQPR